MIKIKRKKIFKKICGIVAIFVVAVALVGGSAVSSLSQESPFSVGGKVSSSFGGYLLQTAGIFTVNRAFATDLGASTGNLSASSYTSSSMDVGASGHSTPAPITTSSGTSGGTTGLFALIANIIKAILTTIITIIGAVFVKAGAWLIATSLSINESILDFNSPANPVIVGWSVFRDLANLGFVFGIIVIAIATILRNKSYAYQSILWKLIVAALLVNFSLVIGGAIIKTSDSFSLYFINSIGGGSPAVVGEKMVDMFRIKGIIVPSNATPTSSSPSFLESIPGVGSLVSIANSFFDLFKNGPSWMDLFSLVVGIMLEILIALTLFGVAFMLFLRYFWLVFLLILSPIVFLFWVFPSTKSYWNMWWKNFIHWSLYAPAMTFFIWLVVTIGNRNTFSAGMSNLASSATGGSSVSFLGGVSFGLFLRTLVLAALLIGGMKASQSIGYGGTSLAIGAVNGTSKWAKGKAIRGSKRVGGAISRPVSNGLNKLAGKIPRLPFVQSKFGRSIGIHKLAGVAGGVSAAVGVAVGQKGEEFSRASLDKITKDYSKYSPERLEILRKYKTGVKKDVATKLLASAGKLKVDPTNKEEMMYTRNLAKKLEKFGYDKKGKEIKSLNVAMGRNEEIEKTLASLKTLNTSTQAYADTVKKLGEETDKFLGDLTSKEREKAVSKMFKQDFSPKDIPNLEYKNAILNHVTDESTGKSFYGINGGLKKKDDSIRFLVGLIDGVKERIYNNASIDTISKRILRTDLDGAVNNIRSGNYADALKTIKDVGKDSKDVVIERLSNRINKSIFGDLGYGREDTSGKSKGPNSSDKKP